MEILKCNGTGPREDDELINEIATEWKHGLEDKVNDMFAQKQGELGIVSGDVEPLLALKLDEGLDNLISSMLDILRCQIYADQGVPMEKRMRMLEEFKKQLIEEERAKIKKEYLCMFNTLSDCLSCEYVSRIERLEKLLEKSDEGQLKRFAEDCEKASKDYAADWYDEDLEVYRSGYQWESDFEWSLRNIALGKNTLNPYQAGYGI